MKVLTAEAMAAVDRRLIEEVGVPGPVLMENAALGVVEAIAGELPDARSAWIACGPGNNGGDGIAVGRLLAARGYRVELFLAFAGDRPAGDAGTQLSVAESLDLPRLAPPTAEWGRRAAERAAGFDVVVDALFGTGLSRPLEGAYAELVGSLRAVARPRVAVDLPSGLFGGRSDLPGPHLPADLTVTFAAPKIAHVLGPAAEACGEVVVADLGVPAWLVEEAPGDLFLTEAVSLAPVLEARPPEGHKGTFGHVLVAGGSPGKAGAVILACRGAVRAGAGLVTAAVPASLLDVVDGASVESMTLALEAGDDGALSEGAVPALVAAAADRDVVVLGPGLGESTAAREAARRAALEIRRPLVLDADGLNAFAGRAGGLAGRAAPTVLTPHPGELARLLDLGVEAIQSDRPAAVRRAVEATGAVVVLKGHRTLVGVPGGGVHVNPTGNPGMATGGAGDVLAGMIGALVAQTGDPGLAAVGAVYLHGLAGDVARDRGDEIGLAAGDLLVRLPEAFRLLRERCAAG